MWQCEAESAAYLAQFLVLATGNEKARDASFALTVHANHQQSSLGLKEARLSFPTSMLNSCFPNLLSSRSSNFCLSRYFDTYCVDIAEMFEVRA